ncbi:ribosomal acidic phosphoprotein P1 [Tieghemostelium lacteum]|uniref:Ribosomal acidic phosphoprotein P1 n=1 Tax=Tieghemostelium lacteum TaxID=361077 RepID=A0A152AAB4_TIELA|nr:ribosomal acidic phosphoprotein P1 [Tieghemostelium lacteum]|eukprot:KYR03160.1 ribosomal acidic phosphoprotein P1 [Tieghemostelium lacteum]
MEQQELACIYSGLLLQDDKIEITDAKIKTILEAAGVTVASHWPGLYARLLAKTNIEDLLLNAGGSSVAATPAATTTAATTTAAKPTEAAAKTAPKKEEKKEESDEDMGMSLFD